MYSRIRQYVFVGSVALLYTMVLVVFFGGELPWGMMGGVSQILVLISVLLGLVFVINIALPDLQKTGIIAWKLIFVVSYIGVFGLYIWWGGAQDLGIGLGSMMLSGSLLQAGLRYLLDIKHIGVSNRIHLYVWMMHYGGVFAFSLFVAGGIGFYATSRYAQVPFSCEDIQTSQETFYETLFFPVRKGTDIFDGAKAKVTMFLERDVSQVMLGDEGVVATGGNTTTGGVLGYVEYLKEVVVTETLENKKLVDTSVCALMIELIGEQWKQSGFRLSVVLLIFLLVYPFLSISFFVISVLSYVLFVLGERIGIWKRRVELREVEERE